MQGTSKHAAVCQTRNRDFLSDFTAHDLDDLNAPTHQGGHVDQRGSTNDLVKHVKTLKNSPQDRKVTKWSNTCQMGTKTHQNHQGYPTDHKQHGGNIRICHYVSDKKSRFLADQHSAYF